MKPPHFIEPAPEMLQTAAVDTDLPEASEDEDIYRRLFVEHHDGIAILDLRTDRFLANKALAQMLDSTRQALEAPGAWKAVPLFHCLDSGSVLQEKIRQDGAFADYETTFQGGNGAAIFLSMTGTIITNRMDGKHVVAILFRDIASRKRIEARLRRNTGRLAAHCSFLKRELRATLRKLSDSRTALDLARRAATRTRHSRKILVQGLLRQKQESGSQITRHLETTVYPLLEHLRALAPSESVRHVVEALYFNIQHVTSDFETKVSGQARTLTGREMEVCDMIRSGKRSREISDATGLSYETVMTHRKNIRKKLGLKKKQNLASYIQNTNA